jgi:hypothetical protein
MKESPQLIPMEISTKIHHLVDIKESYIIMIFSIQMELYCTTLLLLLMLLLWLQMLWHGVPSRLILPRAKIVKEGITVGEALHRFVGWLVGWFVDWLVGWLLVGYVCVCVCVCVLAIYYFLISTILVISSKDVTNQSDFFLTGSRTTTPPNPIKAWAGGLAWASVAPSPTITMVS